MKNIALLCTIITLANSCTGAGKWLTTENGQRFYVEIEEKFTWFEAIDKCTQLNMSLISMDSQKKTQEVNKLYTTNFGSLNYNLWTGGHDHNVSRHFEWISTGEPFGYTNWESSQPNYANQHCVFMATGYSLEWYDNDCSGKNGLVCEENHLQQVTNNEWVLVKASLDNQTNLLKEKTEKLDSLEKEFNIFKKESREILTNLKLQFDEHKKQGLEEMKQKQEEIAILQKSSELHMTQLNKMQKELNALKAQISHKC